MQGFFVKDFLQLIWRFDVFLYLTSLYNKPDFYRDFYVIFIFRQQYPMI